MTEQPETLQAANGQTSDLTDGLGIRTAQQIVDQTNELARTLYRIRGYAVDEGYRFDLATHPHEEEAWRGACEAQILLTDTDPYDAIDELET